MRKNLDLWFFLPALFLSLLGLMIAFSLSSTDFTKQGIFLIISLFAFFLFKTLDFHLWQVVAVPLYLISNLLLFATYLFGVLNKGSARWLEINSLRFQPSELIKPLLIIFFAFVAAKLKIKSLKELLLYCLLALLPAWLIFIQPDLGSSLVIIALAGGIILGKRIKIKLVLLLFFLALIAGLLLWQVLKPYQKSRIYSFANPGKDQLGASYSQYQAMLAIGSGKFFGKGLGRGTQSRLLFLPEYKTDFVFSGFTEEFGFVGAFILLCLYFIIFIRFLIVAQKIEADFFRLSLFGIFSYLWFQTTIHIGMNIGLLPVTGITLPLVSSGGSSLLSTWISLGLAQSSIDSFNQKQKTQVIQ